MKKRSKIKRVAAMIVCTGALLTLFTSCSGINTGTSSEKSSGTESDTTATMNKISESLSSVSGTPTFFAQKFGTVDAKKVLTGKKIMLVAYDSTNDWCVNYVKMANAVYSRIGAKPFITYCNGTADSWISAVQTAINQKYDAIDLFGISNIGVLKDVIEEAKAAGIYVQDTHGTDISDNSSNASSSVGCNYTLAGKMMALQAIKEVGDPSKVNCLVVADVGWGADSNVRAGITEVFKQYNVKYKMADVSISDWTKGIGNAVRNAFVADESYNAVITFYDNMCLYVVPELQQLGVDLNKVAVGSFNGSPGLIDYVKSGKIKFDLGESTGWCAFHAADNMARSFAKQQTYSKSGFAMYMITTQNVNKYIDPKTKKASYAYDGVQNVYVTGYSKLWNTDMKDVFSKVNGSSN